MIIESFLPLGLWVASVGIGLVVCVSCVINGAVMPSARSRISSVHPVAWGVVALHLVSVVVGAMAYAVFLLVQPFAGVSIVKWYESVGLISAVVIVALAAAQLVLLYWHACNAMKGEMDRSLHGKS